MNAQVMLFACSKCFSRHPFEELSHGQQLCKVRSAKRSLHVKGNKGLRRSTKKWWQSSILMTFSFIFVCKTPLKASGKAQNGAKSQMARLKQKTSQMTSERDRSYVPWPTLNLRKCPISEFLSPKMSFKRHQKTPLAPQTLKQVHFSLSRTFYFWFIRT